MNELCRVALDVQRECEKRDWRFCFTAIPQHEENEVLTAFLQRGGGEIWIWAIAGFSGRKLFPE